MCLIYMNTVLRLVNFTSQLPADLFTSFCFQVEVFVPPLFICKVVNYGLTSKKQKCN